MTEERPDNIALVFEKQRQNSLHLRYADLTQRKIHLKAIRKWIRENRSRIHQALYDDFQKPAMEVDGTEIFHIQSEISLALRELDRWAGARKIDAPLTMIGTTSFIQYEPRGVCLIISPWNYPFSLCIGPLISALAAGNCVVLKPSELTPHISSLIRKMAEDLFNEALVYVVEGGPEAARQLLQLPFDHIFFTGSPAIGKAVMRAAAENLSSVTLELGGKTPTIVSETAVIKDAAQRIAVSKFVNNGQTCVAPDYLLVHHKIFHPFLDELRKQIEISFRDRSSEAWEDSRHYARIVNYKHFARLESLLLDAIADGSDIYFGGHHNRSTRFFEPTLLINVPGHSRIMHEEIFGPILPVLVYKDLQEAIDLINRKPKPLALYFFGSRSSAHKKVLKETAAGGTCINDCAIHFLHHNLPFGGVSQSGIGKSHGYAGFIAFSNERPVLLQRKGFTSVKLFYPPYTRMKERLMKLILKFI